MAEYSRVLIGARMVLNQYIKRSNPAVRTSIERNMTHVADLLAVMMDITKIAANQPPSSSSSGSSGSADHAGSPTAESSFTSATSNFAAASSPIIQEAEYKPIKVDDVTTNSSTSVHSAVKMETSQLNIEAETQPKETLSNPIKPTIPYDPIGFETIEEQSILSSQSDPTQQSVAFNNGPIDSNSSQHQQTTTINNSQSNNSNSNSNSNKGKMRERAVPSTQFGRLMGFGSLAVQLAFGEAVDRASHAFSSSNDPQQKRTISEENAERLAESLCRMRGAALKLGQMLSIQDESSLPPALVKALERVKQGADYMPRKQLEQQLTAQYGTSAWQEKYFREFDYLPIAAASIGQVHRAVLLDGTVVAMKIQYPGVAESIDSDLQNLKVLVTWTNILPPGLFVDNIIAVASKELKEECDYALEATSQQRYRELISADPILRKHVNVPEVYPELCTSRILVTRLIPGINIDKATQYSQKVRNAIARTVLVLSIRELFEWRFIQSDPNFANFLYHDPSCTIHLIDFGAARGYEKSFVDGYMKLVWAAANKDRAGILEVSKDLGFLTGDESKKFLDAHVEAGLVVGEPFVSSEPFDFANSHLTQRIGQYGGTFMQYRLTPPPSEAYSLHRKLAGAFLLCIKLKAKIPCRDILEETWKQYQFSEIKS